MQKPVTLPASTAKQSVQSFWNTASCGELGYAVGPNEITQLANQATARYQLEPYILPFANTALGQGQDVLEIGVGMGADHLAWAQAKPRSLTGVDLTPRAIRFAQARLQAAQLPSTLLVADAEQLPFPNASFDVVYSWGVLHHSPDTPQAFAEVARVLRPGGTAKIMVYHTYSLTGFMLWLRYALLAGKPLTSLASIYAQHLESPGTKAYSARQVKQLLLAAGFTQVAVTIQLNHGDLLQGAVGQRHQGRLLAVAKALWPRWFFRTVTPFLGLYLLITAQK